MSNKSLSFIPILIFLFSFCIPLTALGQKESTSGTVSLTGVLSLAGNEPHTELILRDENQKVYKITGEKIQDLIREGIGKQVRLEGILEQKDSASFGPPHFIVENWEILNN